MTSAQDYESLARHAYFADPLAQKPPAKTGERFFTGNDSTNHQWEVFEVSANASNGFQAMAVVPVVNGVRDESHIFIAYAGTNFGDPHDVAADIGLMIKRTSAQAEEAKAFADKVQKAHHNATIETVGHSFGGYLAQRGTELRKP